MKPYSTGTEFLSPLGKNPSHVKKIASIALFIALDRLDISSNLEPFGSDSSSPAGPFCRGCYGPSLHCRGGGRGGQRPAPARRDFTRRLRVCFGGLRPGAATPDDKAAVARPRRHIPAAEYRDPSQLARAAALSPPGGDPNRYRDSDTGNVISTRSVPETPTQA
jgi:hypothetical protein